MSRRWQAQSADGIIQEIPGVGIMKTWSSLTTPTNAANPAGYGPGCLWFYTPVSGPPRVFQNIGGNGMYVGATQNTVASWIEVDATSLGQGQFGLKTGTAFFNTSGTYYRTALAAAGTNPTASALLKIVDAVAIPAGTLDLIGRFIRFTVTCNITAGSNEAQRIQVVANPTNTSFLTAAPWLPLASNASNTGQASKTDGSVTLTGGTVVLDSGSLTYNAVAVSGFQIQGELYFRGVNALSNMVTRITTGTTEGGVSAVADSALVSTAAIIFVVVVSTASTATNIGYCGMKVEVLN